MTIRNVYAPCAAIVAALGYLALPVQAAVILPDTVAEFAPNGNVQFEAVGNTKTLAAFTSDVAAAHAFDAGGVIDFGVGFSQGQDGFLSNYGVNQLATFTATADAGYSDLMVAGFSSVDETSDSSSLYTRGFNGGGLDVKLLFTGVAGGIGELGFTSNGRGNVGNGQDFQTGDVIYTVDFSGGGTASQTISHTSPANTSNTFVYFAAPTGEEITALRIDATGITNNDPGDDVVYQSTDDLAFIQVGFENPIPEPTSIALAGLAGVALLIVNRRQRR